MIELMAVLVILGLAAMVVVPMLGQTGDIDSTAAARALTSDLLYAQNYAITHQTKVQVTFNTTTNQYTLTEVPAVGSPTVLTHPVTRRPYTVGFNATSGLPSVTIPATTFVDQVLIFDSLGSPSPAGGSVTLTSGRFTRTVTVANVTGKVTVQ